MSKFAAIFLLAPSILCVNEKEMALENNIAYEEEASFEEKLFQEIGGDEIALEDDEEARKLFETDSGMLSMSDEKEDEVERTFQ